MRKYCIDMHHPFADRAVAEKGKFWKRGETLGVTFLNGTDAQKQAVRRFAQAWSSYANIVFQFDVPVSESEIRISFYEGWGSWSFVGTDCLLIDKTNPTMNFGWVTGGQSAYDMQEDRAVILHEFGHALGLGHEHQNPEGGIKWNIEEVVKDLSGAPNFWDRETIEHNVLRAYSQDRVLSTVLDPKSIMMYPIPQEWTLNSFSTGFNTELSQIDRQFIAELYPVVTSNPPEPKPYDNTFYTLKFMFQSRKELNTLKELQLVRAGLLLELPVNIKKRKRENLDIVVKHLGLL